MSDWPHKLNMKVLTEVDKTGSQVCDTLVWSLAYCCGRRLTRTNSLVYKHCHSAATATTWALVKLWKLWHKPEKEKVNLQSKSCALWNTLVAAMRQIFTQQLNFLQFLFASG